MTKRILIIDDEADIRTYLGAALEDNGYDVCPFDDTDEPIETIRRERPDLITLDVMMPRRSGISLYKEIVGTPGLADTPVLLITGMAPAAQLDAQGFRELAKDSDIRPPAAVIEKPVQIPTLLARVREALGDE